MRFVYKSFVGYSLIFGYCGLPLAAQSPKSASPEGGLRSEIHSCENVLSSATSCKLQLQVALKALLNPQNKVMDRHLDDLASSSSTVVNGRKLSPNVETQLVSTIVAVVRDSDLASAAVLGKLRDLKSMLASTDVPESNRTKLIGSLTVVSQDVRGPEDEGAQILPGVRK